MEIRQLGYVGLEGPDPKAWLDFATRVGGLMPARVVPGEAWGPALPGLPRSGPTGRHSNHRMFSFYVRSPVGFDVEIGCGGLLVDASWTPSRVVEGDVWGHQGLSAEALEAAAKKLSAAC